MPYNSTIVPKKRNLECGCFDYAFSRNRCKAHAQQQDGKPIKKISDKRMANEFVQGESFSNLVSDLDEIFSKYIRIKHSNKDGIAKCYTSGVELPYTILQCGHFIPRSHLSTRWLEENCRPQAQFDNCYLSGNLKIFATNLDIEKKGTTKMLYEMSKEIYKPTISELKELIIEYRGKVRIAKLKFKQ